MRHEIHVTGAGFALRPVTEEDSEFIIDLRTNPALGRFLNVTSPRREDQLAWLGKYFLRPGDYYFIVTRKDGTPEGAVALYDVTDTSEGRVGEWGRWILRPGSLAALESALLIYTVAFEHAGLDMAYCRTIVRNEPVVSFHTSCGLSTHGIVKDNMVRDGVSYDAVEQRLTKQEWPKVKENLTPQATRLARRLSVS